MSRDPYAVLGVPSTASEAEIRRAFRVLAKRYHPDVNGGDPAAARRFLEVGNAADTLLDPRRRASYDESRAPRAPAGPPAAAPKPSPPPGTSRTAGTPPPTSPAPAGQPFDFLPASAVRAVAAAAVIAVSVWGIAWGLSASPKQQESDLPANETVVWKAAGFGPGDGWGINLARDRSRFQIVPGTRTDIEVADGIPRIGRAHRRPAARRDPQPPAPRQRRPPGSWPV